MKSIRYWTDWHCKCCCKVTGRHVLNIHKNKILHLQLAINNFTETFLYWQTWSIMWLPTSLEKRCFTLSFWPFWPLLLVVKESYHCFHPLTTCNSSLFSFKKCLSKYVTNMHSLENTNKAERKGWAVYRSGNTWLYCLHASESPVYRLVATLFICLMIDSLYNMPNGYSRTQVRSLILFQFLCSHTYVQCTILSDFVDPQSMSSTG